MTHSRGDEGCGRVTSHTPLIGAQCVAFQAATTLRTSSWVKTYAPPGPVWYEPASAHFLSHARKFFAGTPIAAATSGAENVLGALAALAGDRTSVVEGKSVSVSVN